MIQVSHISKFYGKKQVLNDLTFPVYNGELFVVVGGNGAGKSSLFNILASLDDAYDGNILINGMELRKNKKQIREKIGYVPGRLSLYNDLTINENISFFASAYGFKATNIKKLCPLLWESLEPFSNKQVKNLSGGMKQKLAVCCALVHQPKLIILDEPTTGLDPLSRHILWQELKSYQTRETSIIISTHYLEEAAIADRVLFMHEGNQLMLDQPENILAGHKDKLLSLSGYPVQDVYRIFKEMPRSKGCYIRGEKVFLSLPPSTSHEMISEYALSQGFNEIISESVAPDLEDILIGLLSAYK